MTLESQLLLSQEELIALDDFLKARILDVLHGLGLLFSFTIEAFEEV